MIGITRAIVDKQKCSGSKRRKIDSAVHRGPLQTIGLFSLAAATLASVVLLAGCSGQASGSNQNTVSQAGVTSVNSVTVTGEATVSAPPDEAVVVLTVEKDAPTATAAMDAASKQSNLLLTALKGLGIEDAAIQTSGVTLYPTRTYNSTTGTETLTGYRADNSMKITLKDAPTVAKVLAAGVDAGVTIVSGPEWRLRDDSKAVDEALKLAVTRARAKAQVLAAAEGVSIGQVITMTEGSVQVPVPLYTQASGAAMDSAKVAEPAVSSGTLDVTATVSIMYTLKH